MHNAEDDACACEMRNAPTLQKGERFDVPRLVGMGLLPPEFLRAEIEQWPEPSIVVNVDPETRTVTFDSLPRK